MTTYVVTFSKVVRATATVELPEGFTAYEAVLIATDDAARVSLLDILEDEEAFEEGPWHFEQVTQVVDQPDGESHGIEIPT